MDEKEYNDPKSRLREHSSIRIYEDKRIGEIQNELFLIENKLNKLIRMLTAHDYSCKEREKK